MMFFKEFQEQLLENSMKKKPFFISRTNFDGTEAESENFVSVGVFLHPIDPEWNIVRVEVEMYRNSNLITCGVINIKKKLFLPFFFIQLEPNGPLDITKENIKDVYRTVMLKGFFNAVDLLFHEDGSIDREEVNSILPPHSLKITYQPHLIAGAAGVLFSSGNNDLPFVEFCRSLLTDHNHWYSEVETQLSKCCITEEMIARCVFCERVQKQLAYMDLIHEIVFANDFVMINDLYHLAKAMQFAKHKLSEAPKAHVDAASGALKKLKTLKGKAQIKVCYTTKTEPNLCDFYDKAEFFTKISPLGIVGSTASREITSYNFEMHSWDQIKEIKCGKAVLFPIKSGGINHGSQH